MKCGSLKPRDNKINKVKKMWFLFSAKKIEIKIIMWWLADWIIEKTIIGIWWRIDGIFNYLIFFFQKHKKRIKEWIKN